MVRRTDGERVDFLPEVFHGKKLRFTGREVVK
jgi:hypothetical protein